MRNLTIFIIVIALGAIVPVAAAPRFGGGGGARGGGGQRGGGGFDLHNDASFQQRQNAGADRWNRNAGGNPRQGFNLSNDAPSGRAPNANRTDHPPGGNRTGNKNVNVSGSGNRNVNVSGNNVNVNRNVNVHNGYGYRGAVIVNPVYRGPAWGWNHGVVWVPATTYWGGGFWGPFAAGVATAVVMGAIINSANQQKYTSYQVQPSSPGAQLLSNYHLQQVPCGPPNLVVIYGPNNGVICANPNNLVAPGTYAVNTDTLTLQAP